MDTSKLVRLNVHRRDRGHRTPAASLAVLAYVAPDSGTCHDVLMGHDGLEPFPGREVRDVTLDDTVLKLDTTIPSEPAAKCFASEIND